MIPLFFLGFLGSRVLCILHMTFEACGFKHHTRVQYLKVEIMNIEIVLVALRRPSRDDLIL